MPWTVLDSFLRRAWAPGEHVSIFGPTDSGKSHLSTRGLLPVWLQDSAWKVLLVDVKSDDPTLKGQGTAVRQMPGHARRQWDGYWQELGDRFYRLALPRGVENVVRNRNVVRRALRRARDERRWVIHLNEVRALSDPRPPCLNLLPELEELWLRGRPHVTILAEAQRPAWAPGSMYDQPVHLFFGKVLDKRAQDRLREIGGATELIRDAIRQLRRDEWVYVNRVTGEVVITKLGKGRPPLPRLLPD